MKIKYNVTIRFLFIFALQISACSPFLEDGEILCNFLADESVGLCDSNQSDCVQVYCYSLDGSPRLIDDVGCQEIELSPYTEKVTIDSVEKAENVCLRKRLSGWTSLECLLDSDTGGDFEESSEEVLFLLCSTPDK